MKIVLLILTAFQVLQPSTPVRGDRFQIAVPQGWKVLNAGDDVMLQHSSGASLLLLRAMATTHLQEFAERQAERIMAPLGFANLGEAQHYKNGNDEWFQYEIRGNRVAEHRRILYRAFRRGASVFELVYENNEDRFDQLLTEAQEIASSLQTLAQAPPARRRPVRR